MKPAFLVVATLLTFFLSNAYALENVTFVNGKGNIINYDYFVHGKVELDRKNRCRTTAARRILYSDDAVIKESNGFTLEDCTSLNDVVHTERSLYCSNSEQSHLAHFSDYKDLVEGMEGAKRKLNQLAAKIYVKCMAMGRKQDVLQQAYESTDSDGDGIFDPFDECPYEGDEGFGIYETGCPVLDSDGDGVSDIDDQYPSDYDNDGIPTQVDTDDTVPAPLNIVGSAPLETQAGIITLNASIGFITYSNGTSVNGSLYYLAGFSLTYTLDYTYDECTLFAFGSCVTWTARSRTTSEVVMNKPQLITLDMEQFDIEQNNEIPPNDGSNYRNVRIVGINVVSTEIIAEKQ